MPTLSTVLETLPIPLATETAVPLHRQIYAGVRTAILNGTLRAGTRLPATRTLAASLGVSRTTVLTAFDQLLAEGYLLGKVGDGTYVTPNLPDTIVRPNVPPWPTPARAAPALSKRGRMLAAEPVSAAMRTGPPLPFRPGVPALDAFPIELWSRLLARALRDLPDGSLGYGEPAGWPPLREAIAAYVGAARGVRCDAAQVVVVSGSQQALDLIARVLLDPGDAAWIEDPGYAGARGALRGAGIRLAPVPVDADGLDVATGIERERAARLAYVTPSHQFPLGMTMSLPRRLALLEWARRADAWIVEDDYDSEFRYTGRPLAALQGLDADGRVIYVGTFSKVLVPALRLGYLVAPPALVEAFVAARSLADRQPPAIEQAALAAFIAEGHFARHLRRMRTLYAARQAAFLDEARTTLAGVLDVPPCETGMHVIGWLPAGSDDRRVARRLLAAGIEAPPLSAFALTPMPRPGLALGYATFSETVIRNGVQVMATVLQAMEKRNVLVTRDR